jgi:hypothetical protein
MATHRFVKKTTQGKQGAGNRGSDRTSDEMPAIGIPSERRREARKDFRCMCTYEVLEAIEEKPVGIRQGQAFAFNQSAEGMLLLIGVAPREKQLIEVHNPRSGWGKTANVFETRWTKPLPVESLGSLYLVGCKRIFGPLDYLSF